MSTSATVAGTLADLLHSGTAYPSGSVVLAAGCGAGAQTVTLAQRSPNAQFTSAGIPADSTAEARQRADEAGLTNVAFRQADIFALPFSTSRSATFRLSVIQAAGLIDPESPGAEATCLTQIFRVTVVHVNDGKTDGRWPRRGRA